jgi:hypothetical protein
MPPADAIESRTTGAPASERLFSSLAERGYFPAGAKFQRLPLLGKPRLYVMASPSWGRRWSFSESFPANRSWARTARVFGRCLHAAGIHAPAQTAAAPWRVEAFLQGLDLDVRYVSVFPSSLPGRVTLELRDSSGRKTAYLKHAWSEPAVRHLEREYEALRMAPAGLAPSAMRFGGFSGGLGLLMSSVPGRAVRPTPRPAPAVAEYLRKLARPNEWTEAHSHWPDPVDPPLRRAVATLSRRRWISVIEHGDFAPWNVLRSPDGLRAIDWENARPNGFPHLDLAYHLLQTAALVPRLAPRAALRLAAEYLAGAAGLSYEEAAAVCRLSSFDAYRRSEADSVTASDRLQLWRKSLWQVSE